MTTAQLLAAIAALDRMLTDDQDAKYRRTLQSDLYQIWVQFRLLVPPEAEAEILKQVHDIA